MNQLTQKLKSGEMKIIEVPLPVLNPGMVLVRNHFSLISAGTEGSTVKTARKSLLMKARERPQQVRQVMDVLKKQGVIQTYRAVMKKLDAYSPLGYSSSGEIIETAADVFGLKVGDWVACAGAGYANHAEYVSVPVNLCVRLPSSSCLKQAAFNTLGAIALQGIRQADLRLGESCAVIGLGLLGQLTLLMLKASGVRTVGIDIDRWSVDTAASLGCDLPMERSTQNAADRVLQFSHGLGVDAAIITAGTTSLDPVNFAGEIARKKGRIIVVGAVPTGFDRDPHYYRKELELRMSCSYGPGRYDFDYEELGIDYPAAYVRWTENRNMEAFQDLIHTAKINVDPLITHLFTLQDAPSAYDMILKRSEPFMAILIGYDTSRTIRRTPVELSPSKTTGPIGIAFIGAGSYAQSHLLPNIPANDTGIILKTVLTTTGTTSRRVAEKFGFEKCASEDSDIFTDPGVNTVFIATRHDSHAAYVKKAVESGRHVFVEKPLCLNTSDLDTIRGMLESGSQDSGRKQLQLMVGFNRRFAPLAEKLKERLSADPMAMLYRVNAGSVPADHWIQKMDAGGGRIIGEACHFIDFMTFISGSLPCGISVWAQPQPHNLNDIVSINISFRNGSIGTLAYFSTGAKSLDKEYFEVYQSGLTGIIRDFRILELHSGSKPEIHRLMSQDKGQKKMVSTWIDRVRRGGYNLIPLEQIFHTTLATFYALESIRTRQAINWE